MTWRLEMVTSHAVVLLGASLMLFAFLLWLWKDQRDIGLLNKKLQSCGFTIEYSPIVMPSSSTKITSTTRSIRIAGGPLWVISGETPCSRIILRSAPCPRL